MQQPDQGMRSNLIIGALGDDDQRAAALWITDGELEEHHGGVTMGDKIDTSQPKAVEDAAYFTGAFDQPDRSGACFPPPIKDDAPGLAKRADLASIHKFQVFEY